MIVIKNSQRSFKIDTRQLAKTAQIILDELGYGDFDLGIWLTTNKTIRAYNKQYRDKDKATDILSFPYHQVKAGQKIKVHNEEDKNVGDIIISVQFVHDALPLYNVPLADRLTTILIHGICHLLGYSHYDEANDRLMSALEKKLAKKLSIGTTHKPSKKNCSL